MEVNTVTTKTLLTTLIASSFSFGMGTAYALDDPESDIEHIRVRGDSSVKDGEFISASQGWVSGDTLICLLYTSPSPRDRQKSRMPSSA